MGRGSPDRFDRARPPLLACRASMRGPERRFLVTWLVDQSGKVVMEEEALEPDKHIVRRHLDDADYPAKQRNWSPWPKATGLRRPSSSVSGTYQEMPTFLAPMRSRRRWSAKTKAATTRSDLAGATPKDRRA